jgi:TPR repeat protein
MSLEDRTTRYQDMLKHARPGGTLPKSTPMPMPMLQLPDWPLRIGEIMRALLILFFLLSLAAPVAAGQHDFITIEDGWDALERGDYKTAFQIFQPLAEQGDADAQYNLGVMYHNGEGVPRDYAEAVKWYRLAAEQGDADAQHNLGVMYHKGYGVPLNYVVAHMWFNLSAGQGNKLARQYREKLAANMTSGGVAEAQRLAREWKPTK